VDDTDGLLVVTGPVDWHHSTVTAVHE